jgi:hypothetical protein
MNISLKTQGAAFKPRPFHLRLLRACFLKENERERSSVKNSHPRILALPRLSRRRHILLEYGNVLGDELC